MTFKSKIYVAIIAFSLAVIVAVLAARRIESVWLKPAYSEESEDIQLEEYFYYPFINEAEKAAQSDTQEPLPDRMVIALEEDEAYVPEKQMQKPFFGGQIDLPALAKEQEAYINAQSASPREISPDQFKNNEELELRFNNGYENDPELQRFVRDMRRAMGEDITNTQLSPQEMMDKILNNPQMRKILLEYSKNPKIMQIAEDLIKDAEKRAQNGSKGADNN